MKRAKDFAKALAGTAAGFVVVAILAALGGELSQRLLVGGDEDNAASGIPGFILGAVVGLIIGGYVAGRVVRLLHACPGKPWLILIGPGLWAWLALVGQSAISGDIATEYLTNQLLLGLVMVLVSFAGTLAGARERLSARHPEGAADEAVEPADPAAGAP